METQKLDFWWNIIIGTIVAVAMVFGFVSVLIYHMRTKFRIQKEKLEAIEENRREYIELFQSVSDIVYAHDQYGKIVNINRSAEGIIGRSAGALLGSTLVELLPRYKNPVEAYLKEMLTAQREISGILPVRSALTGRMVVFEYRSSPVRQGGRVVGARGVARDITGRVAHERRIEKSRARIHILLERQKLLQGKLEEFSRETLRMQEEERQWVSRELHDEIGQYLATILFNLEMLKNSMNGADQSRLRRIEEAKKVTTGVLERIRSFLRELRPPPIREIGLGGTVQALVTDFTRRTGLPVTFSREECLEELDNDQKVNVYRVIQESLSNIAKHAQATRVTIGTRADGDTLEIEVSDNGVGFDPAIQLKARGLGLIGIRERLALARGSLRVVSAPGRGTSIQLSFHRPGSSA